MAVPNDWQALSKPDPEFAQMIQDRFGGTAPGFPGFPDITKMRALMAKSKRAMTEHHGGTSFDGIQEKDHHITVRDGSNIVCRSYTPESEHYGGRPVYVVFHGGGFCLGDLSNEELLCRLLCKELDIICINVEYRLAPEHPFPAAPNDCFDATKWVSQNASALGVDLRKGFVINGTSAGGNLTITVCYQWHDEGLQPPITGCHLMNGHFVDNEHVPERAKSCYQSWWELADAPILNHRYSEVFIGHYLPEKSKRGDHLFSVMRREDGPKILPAAYFQISGLDPVRDEALIFESWIREAGTPTKLTLYPGLPHGFWSVFPTLKSSERFFKDAIDGARWLLKK
ncbi:hypothetical protein M409DRAFT_66649 [Zasmidium cellare ATCC 36951]|uniref:Alpha/beta hydrolase fold-3 domain-containing protein n=1 Tax=Zasmidium cellare ATCC 36951 TaxID=1080233 RepID=A0A6A6CLS5_ZASCE|nr:uncharacterized protein M409DRAFT_66649 [Zasmidium cellare ATCC 36951]KAF2166679.1 hypothetical protein M409DRAFT_66649 [Zasmidium cellare ATCC 36951]